MKSNVAIELTDDQRSHLSNIYHNQKNKKLLTRKELNDLVHLMVNDLINLDVGTPKTKVTQRIATEGFTYRFNGEEVTAEEYQMGIHAWLKSKGENS
tara:strand:- start:192 stop:482 length:291 start_codon:yes stop_codon:yes gene_type:complete